MIKVSLIGSGNVAQHLLKAFVKTTDIEMVQVLARTKSELVSLIDEEKIVSDYTALLPTDVIIIAVSDTAIAKVSSQIVLKNTIVVHTSGSISMETLETKNDKGVFYPLQTFSKSKDLDFSEIPIVIEAEDKETLAVLEQLAKLLLIRYK